MFGVYEYVFEGVCEYVLEGVRVSVCLRVYECMVEGV